MDSQHEGSSKEQDRSMDEEIQEESPRSGSLHSRTNTADMESKKQGKATEEEASKGDDDDDDEERLKVGDEVYAEWVAGAWYRGTIMNIESVDHEKKKPCFNQYSIHFDDGDTRDDVTRESIMTVSQFARSEFAGHDPPPRHAGEDGEEATTLTPREMYARRCHQCELCTKPDCGNCSTCKRNEEDRPSDDEREVCLQKMCLLMPEAEKKQPAQGLAQGWTFLFARDKPHNSTRPRVPGLYIYHPDCDKVFRSVEAAVNSVPKLMKGNANVVADFSRHIGIGGTAVTSTALSTVPEETAAGTRSKAIVSVSSSVPTVQGRRKQARCGVCENCTKEACRKCAVCKTSTGGTSSRCFQKMCFKLPIDAKSEPAVGLPPGWRFFFAEHFEESEGSLVVFKPVPGLHIFTTESEKFQSAEAVVSYLGMDIGCEIARDFYAHVGLFGQLPESDQGRLTGLPSQRSGADAQMSEPALEELPRKKAAESTGQYLVGRMFCFNWLDTEDLKKVVYGKVVGCVEPAQSGDIEYVKVFYDSHSRSLLNCKDNHCSVSVPETQILPASLVIGGCVRMEKQLNVDPSHSLLHQVGNRMPNWNWISPDFRLEDMVETSDGTLLPRLALVFRGFQLELNVKPSTIANAGYGVFLSCKRLMVDDDQPLQLKPGELLDAGVYAPLHEADKKLDAVLFSKNFVLSRKCEEWAFDAGDSTYKFDLTDDVTGELHSEAMKHVHAYVNETNDENNICVRGEHDPEGCLHYLLGHAHESQGDFVLPSDGTEVEIFMNYGDGYEKIRVRKGYGFHPDLQPELLEAIDEDDITDVIAMGSFVGSEVAACVDFFLRLFLTETGFAKETIQRALVCAAVLQRRVSTLRDDDGNDEEDDEDDSPLDLDLDELRDVASRSRQLVSLLLHMVEKEEGAVLYELQAGGDVDGFLARVLGSQFRDLSETELSSLLDNDDDMDE